MPVEPPPVGWVLPDPARVESGRELVAVGADLSPGSLLAGYRSGLFAMPERGLVMWWSPDPRGVLRPGAVHVSRSLRRALPGFTVSVDRAFAEVVAGCADPRRPGGWISRAYRRSYQRLHELGWAHSVEVWDGSGDLAGGLFGVEVGGLFAAESKFHWRQDASKVAVVALADRLAADGDPRRIVDVQWATPHLASLGVVEIPRTTYLAALAEALVVPPAVAGHAPGAGASRIRWRTT